MDTILQALQHRKGCLVVLGGLVTGLFLGLLISCWLWPVEWSNTAPSDLAPEYRDEYLVWVSDKYASTGDLEWALSALGEDSWEDGELAETLEKLALERGGQEGIRLMVLAMTIDELTGPTSVSNGTTTGQWSNLLPMFSAFFLLFVVLAGGAFTLIRRNIKQHSITYEITGVAGIFEDRPQVKPASRTVISNFLIQHTHGLRRFLSNWQNLLPLAIIGIFLFAAIAAPWLAPSEDPNNTLPFKLVDSRERTPLPPRVGLPLGTSVFFESPEMQLHYDVYHSLIWGTRAALRFGLVVVLLSAGFGIIIGAASAYIGGWFNSVVMRITDGFLAFPLIAAVWLFQQIMARLDVASGYYTLDAWVVPLTQRQRLFAALGIEPVTLAFILFSWMPFARIINANVLKLKQTEYILAAKAVGVKPHRIILRHLLPNAIAPAIVLIARDIGGLVILQAAFAFIGIGGTITGDITEWNRLLLLGRTWIIGIGGNLLLYWWMYIPVTLALVIFGVGWNMLGDRLNVLLSPWDMD
jgi:peptide/nickel transport system permease protein